MPGADPLYVKVLQRFREGGVSGIVRSVPRYAGFHAKRLWLTALAYQYRLLPWNRTFQLGGQRYRYFFHPQNATWRNERCVELSLAFEVLSTCSGRRILEVGNVLHRYTTIDRDVLDKYERVDGVINQDVVEFSASRPYDLIVSISTLEHVGWDEADLEPDKVLTAFGCLRSLLAPGGRLWVTVPRGYHRFLDQYVDQGVIPFTAVAFIRRSSRRNWHEVSHEEVRGIPYGVGFEGAIALMIGVFDRPGGGDSGLDGPTVSSADLRPLQSEATTGIEPV